METNWLKVGTPEDFPVNGGSCVLVDNHQIAIFNYSKRGEWYATDNRCPHRHEMILARGMIGDMKGEPKVACPFHKKTFSLKTGECLTGEEYCIKTYPVKVENGNVFISIEK